MMYYRRSSLSKHEYVKKYYSQNELLRELYDSGDFTDDELLYIFNNNTLKRLGFPMKRGGKNFRNKQKRKLFGWRFFDILEKTISEKMLAKTLADEFFCDFVNIKNISIGDENKFSMENK